MIKTEFFKIRDDGAILVRTYSTERSVYADCIVPLSTLEE